MKNLCFNFVLWSGLQSFAQYNHDIALLNGDVVTHSVGVIDSISFSNGGTPVYHLTLTDGNTVEYALEAISMVSFSGAPLHPYPAGTVHCIPLGTEVVEVISAATGRIWMDRNLGAAQVAFAQADVLAYGDLYQWGRFSDGHQCRNSGTLNAQADSPQPGHAQFIFGHSNWLSQNDTELWQDLTAPNNPCPLGFRIPTDAEWFIELLNWTEGTNANGAFLSPLKLTSAGLRGMVDGIVEGEGSQGRYWSSTIAGGNSSFRLVFDENGGNTLSISRGHGSSVRCIKD